VDVDPVIPPVNRRRVIPEGFLLLRRKGEREKFDVLRFEDMIVVEDERPLCDLFVKVLSPLGHVVHAAVRGEEAISLLQTQTFLR